MALPLVNVKLTDDLVDKLPKAKAGKRLFVWDAELKRLGVMVTDKGSKSFVYQYRFAGKSRRLTLRARSVDAARREALPLAAELLAGRDPAGVPEHHRDIRDVTLRQMASAYFEARGDFKSRKLYTDTLALHVYPSLGDRAYTSIVTSDLVRLKDSIITKCRLQYDPKDPEHKHAGKGVARNALKVLSTIWNKYACERVHDGYSWPKVISPLADVDSNGNGRALSPAEIRTLWLASGDCGVMGQYVRFLMLTGLRRAAAGTLRVDQLQDGVLSIPGSKTKPAYYLPLSNAALALLESVRRDGCPWFFSLRGDGPLDCYTRIKETIQARAKLNTKWHLHLIRHTVRSLLSELTTPDIAERAMGHKVTGIRGVYDHHVYIPQVRPAMEALATLLRTIVE